MSQVWTVRLARQAQADLDEILMWTSRNFGPVQTRTYATTIKLAIKALGEGPDALGAQARDEVRPGVRILHIARQGRQGRHFLVFRAANGKIIEVLRILHDRLELARHLL